MNIGDEVVIVNANKQLEKMYLEDGPYQNDGETSITVADEKGEIHGAVLAENGQWIETE